MDEVKREKLNRALDVAQISVMLLQTLEATFVCSTTLFFPFSLKILKK